MSSPDMLHPEYLADRARRGTIDPSDRRRLGAHVAACDVCAWEATAIDDFARVRGAAIDEARLARLVGGVLAELPSAKTGPRVLPRPRVATGRWIAAFAAVSVAVFVLSALPSRSAREGSRNTPQIAAPNDVALDAGAIDPAG